MNRTLRLTQLAAAALAVTLGVGAAWATTGGEGVPIVTGGGTATIFNPFNPPAFQVLDESFGFTAIRNADGSVSGQAQFNIGPGLSHVHMDIDSAVVDPDGTGTLVLLGGIVTGASNPNIIGRTFGFAVSDGGTGPNAGDQIGATSIISPNTIPDVWSLVFTAPAPPPFPQYETFGDFFLGSFFYNGPPANVNGNITIH